jgi:hypothetical protein
MRINMSLAMLFETETELSCHLSTLAVGGSGDGVDVFTEYCIPFLTVLRCVLERHEMRNLQLGFATFFTKKSGG